MAESESREIERVGAVLYPLADTRAIAIGPTEHLDALGREEGAVGESWLRIIRQSLGVSGPLGDLATAADGQIVRLTAKSAKLLRDNVKIRYGLQSVYGVVRNPQTGHFAGLAFPHYVSYSALVDRSSAALGRLGVGVLLVSKEGAATEAVAPAGGPVL